MLLVSVTKKIDVLLETGPMVYHAYPNRLEGVISNAAFSLLFNWSLTNWANWWVVMFSIQSTLAGKLFLENALFSWLDEPKHWSKDFPK